tara:strand:- start:29228 stop:30835 length:1608 start_codon:yes stop_codon:yes gene_type:complete
MMLADFVTLNDYSVGEDADLKNTLELYFFIPKLNGYLQAFFRRATAQETSTLKNLCHDFQRAIIEARNQRGAKYINYIAMWEELSALPSERKDTKALEKEYLPCFNNLAVKEILSEKQSIIEDIENYILQTGQKYRLKEEKNAIEKLDKSELVPFDVYLEKCFEGSRDRNRTLDPTYLQWEGYLNYVKSIITPFYKNKYFTENYRQAELLLQEIDKTLAIIDHNQNMLNTLYFELHQINLEVKSNRHRYTELEMDQVLYSSAENQQNQSGNVKSTSEITIFFQELEVKYNKLLIQQKSLSEQIWHVHVLYQNNNGSLNRTSTLFTSCQKLFEYWFVNLLTFKMRQPDMDKIIGFSHESPGGEEDVIYRHISAAELKNIEKRKGFYQACNACLERAKWFYEKGAQVGNGVIHEFKCNVYLKPGSLKLFQELQKPENKHPAIIYKENERNCFGLHEDILPYFNRLVRKVCVSRRADCKIIKTIMFSQDNLGHPVLNHFERMNLNNNRSRSTSNSKNKNQRHHNTVPLMKKRPSSKKY